MNSWLGGDTNARRWRQVLNLNVLDAQAALGYRANVNALLGIQNRFRSGTAGLDHTVFKQVDRAIAAHLNQLSQTGFEIPWAIEWSRPRFQQTTMSDLQQLRAAAIYDLQMLKRYYKANLSSRPRALLYYELKPDQTIEFIEKFEFELPPTRNREVIEAEIESCRQQIEDIDRQIEQLNEQRDQIQKWLDGINRVRPPGDVAPPMPDDDDDPPPQPDDEPALEDQSNNVTVKKPLVTKPQPENSSDNSRQQELEQLDARRLGLQRAQQQLKDQIEALKQEIVDLDKSESERVTRFRPQMTDLNRFLRPYQEQATKRNDLYFASALESLTTLKTAYLNGANPRTSRAFLSQLDKLRAAQDLLALSNDRRAAAEVGSIAGWLEGAGQAPNLVAAIKAKHSLPNMYLTVSNRLVNEFGSQPVRRVERVNEQILSRLIRGRANVDGNVAIHFTPDPFQARLAINFSGNIHSDTYTRSGPFTAFAGALAQFKVRRDIFANVGGLFASDVYGDMQLGSWFQCIDSRLRLVQKIALKQYYKTKDRSEEISRQRSLDKIMPQFGEQTAEALQGGYEQIDVFSQRQTEISQLLPSIYLHTTGDRLVAIGHRATQYDLAAPVPPSYERFINSDIQARIHESLLSNYVSPLVAGKKLTNEQIAAQFEELLGKSIASEGKEEGDDFSITFEDARPIQFEFEDNKLAVTISGKEFSREGDRIRDGMRIRLELKIVNDAGRLRLLPASDVNVELINPERRNIGNVSFMSFLEGRLSTALAKAFESEVILPNNLIPTENLGPEIKPVAEQLKLVQLRMQTGWFYSGWTYQRPNSYQTWTLDTPGIWPPPTPDQPPLDLNDQDAENGVNESESTTSE